MLIDQFMLLIIRFSWKVEANLWYGIKGLLVETIALIDLYIHALSDHLTVILIDRPELFTSWNESLSRGCCNVWLFDNCLYKVTLLAEALVPLYIYPLSLNVHDVFISRLNYLGEQ